jgi:hypothetical protein
MLYSGKPMTGTKVMCIHTKPVDKPMQVIHPLIPSPGPLRLDPSD